MDLVAFLHTSIRTLLDIHQPSSHPISLGSLAGGLGAALSQLAQNHLVGKDHLPVARWIHLLCRSPDQGPELTEETKVEFKSPKTHVISAETQKNNPFAFKTGSISSFPGWGHTKDIQSLHKGLRNYLAACVAQKISHDLQDLSPSRPRSCKLSCREEPGFQASKPGQQPIPPKVTELQAKIHST